MSNIMRSVSIFLLALFCGIALSSAEEKANLNGVWKLIPEKSSEIGLYETLSIGIDQTDSMVTVIEKWGLSRSYADTFRLKPDGVFRKFPITSRVFPSNVFMGLSMPVGGVRELSAVLDETTGSLNLVQKFRIRSSQGESLVTSNHRYQLSSDGELLFYTINRSTRTAGPGVRYVLKRADERNAFFMRLEDDWNVQAGLGQQAFLISLQGVANVHGPLLYFIYPPTWAFNYTASVFDYYKNQRSYTFVELKSADQALNTLKQYASGYVVWDTSVRTSLIVAFTVAGLERAVVVTEELIPMVEKAGLVMKEDFRGKFTWQSDAQIYTWAYNQYWSRCNKELIVWLGGDAGPVMKPGVADWGMVNKVFFSDLSSRPEDAEEYALANRLLGEMKPMSLVMGWHSYAKDKERDHVTLTSNYGHTVEGLHTLPNFSFNHQIPFSKGFSMKNNHHIEPGKKYTPQKKVYISCVQTDGLGIGAWLKPGRGDIPYAWEVIMNYSWLAPGLLEYFYTLATPNDYFIGCLSGPGYMYPKAVPPKFMSPLLLRAYDLMKRLDLKIFEIMDYSEGATVEGNTELPREIVDAYYQNMPDAIGFINGYAPSHTFTVRDSRPLISYDYYLSPTRPEADAVADLHELAAINTERPYFLLVHVRESSDVQRVKGILDKLSDEFKLVPLDLFMKMAGEKPTFKERFLHR